MHISPKKARHAAATPTQGGLRMEPKAKQGRKKKRGLTKDGEAGPNKKAKSKKTDQAKDVQPASTWYS